MWVGRSREESSSRSESAERLVRRGRVAFGASGTDGGGGGSVFRRKAHGSGAGVVGMSGEEDGGRLETGV